MDVCVGLIDTNPTQLERVKQTLYAPDIAICSFFQIGKNMMTIQSIQSHMAVDYTDHTTIKLMWKAQLEMTWKGRYR
jgi:hypothetical protein